MDFQDYYETLGVARTASQAEIKKAFRKLAREHHPDARPGDTAAERRFKQINEAHAVLSDPEKRKRYDMLGANWDAYSHADASAGGPYAGANPFAGFGRAASGQRGNIRYEFRSTGGDAGDFSEFFRMFFSDAEPAAAGATGRGSAGRGPTLEEILGQMGIDESMASGAGAAAGRGRGRAPTADRATAEATAEITLEEAYHGTTRRVEIDGKRLDVTIPRGADTGTRVKLTGQGPAGGDLVVTVKIRPHPVFTRRGPDLERELPITLDEALLGAEVPVATLKGKVLLTIPAGTQGGRIFRLKGQGMPRLRGDGSGDLLARVKVVLPTNLDDESRGAARRFLDLVDQPDPR
jgi:DnaJ-class molecular chaperone